MAIIKCKECKKEISSKAKKCPHCGAKVPMNKWVKRLLYVAYGFLALVVLIVWLASEPTKQTAELPTATQEEDENPELTEQDKIRLKPDSTVKTKETEAIKELSLSVDNFIKKYNQSHENMGSDLRVTLKDGSEKDNKEYLTLQLQSNKNVAFVLTANNKTRQLKSIIMLGSGDGTMESGFNIMTGAAAVVMALEDPNMKAAQRGKILDDLGMTDNRVSQKDGVKISRGGVKYSISRSDALGTMMAVDSE